MITPIPSHDHGVQDDEDQTNDNHHPVDITTVATATTMTTSNTKTTTTLDDTQSKTVTTPITVGTSSTGSTTTTLVYIPSKEYAWLPARILSTTLNHSNPTKSGGKSNTSNSNSTSSTKTITVAVSIPQSSQDEQSLGLSSLQSHTLKEEIQTLLLPHDDDVLPLQNIVMDHTSIPKVEEEDGGKHATVTRSTLQIVTDLADLPFLHEVRRYCVCVCVCVGNEVYFIL